MAKDQLGIEQTLQTLDHCQAVKPGAVVTRQTAVRVCQFVVLRDVELVGGPDKGAVLGQVDLHYDQAGRMAGRVVQRDALVNVKVGIVERLPLEAVEDHVMAEVDTQISASRHGPAGMLKLLLVDVDWHICVQEVLQTAGVVQVKMADNDGLDILDVVARLLDGLGKLVLHVVLCTREYIGERSTPFLWYC